MESPAEGGRPSKKLHFANFNIKSRPSTSGGTYKGWGLPKQLHSLPIFEHATELLKCIDENDVCILQGDTGCGKTSGVPHLLMRQALERRKDIKSVKDLPTIAITQPRRVAATSLADRVSSQLAEDRFVTAKLVKTAGKVNFGVGGLVGYRIRFDARTGPDTRVNFVTDGLLIRECLMNNGSFCNSLSKYDYVIVDEAHERSVRVDQLLAILKLALTSTPGRKFKLIIMSATMEQSVLLDMYKLPGVKTRVFSIPGRTFPVDTYYLNEATDDIVEAAATATLQLMITPGLEGDILIFLPGAEEIHSCMSILKEKLGSLVGMKKKYVMLSRICEEVLEHPSDHKALFAGVAFSAHQREETSDEAKAIEHLREYFGVDKDLLPDPDCRRLINALQSAKNSSTASIDVDVTGALSQLVADSRSATALHSTTLFDSKWAVCPLYAALSAEEQRKCFEVSDDILERKIIVATNIAETSLTLPRCRAVVDSGKVRVKIGDALRTVAISRSMGRQRAGRAGRVAEGVCLRLLPEDAWENLDDHIAPEICRCDLADFVLELKYMDHQSKGRLRELLGQSSKEALDIMKFPLPSEPEERNVKQALEVLRKLRVMGGPQLSLTQKGVDMQALPLTVGWSNLVLESFAFRCTDEILKIVAMLSIDVIWFPQLTGSSEETQKVFHARKRLFNTQSDHISLLNLFDAYLKAKDRKQLLQLLRVEEKHLKRAIQVYKQLEKSILDYKSTNTPRHGEKTRVQHDQKIPKLTDVCDSNSTEYFETLAQCLLHGLILKTAVKANAAPKDGGVNNRTAIGDRKDMSVVYLTETGDELCIHPTSVLFSYKTERPECIVYSSVIETNRVFARDVTAIQNSWLLKARASLY